MKRILIKIRIIVWLLNRFDVVIKTKCHKYEWEDVGNISKTISVIDKKNGFNWSETSAVNFSTYKWCEWFYGNEFSDEKIRHMEHILSLLKNANTNIIA